MNSPWIRKSLLCGLALLLAGMGPGAQARLPRALTVGSEEEVRHADSQLIGGHVPVQLRPAKRRTAHNSNRAGELGRLAALRVGKRKLTIVVPRSLRALQIQIEV